ncbi:MAG: PadR family transcriptional regulator [Candidatus Thermoplasmatota archaeon]|nr:PadR family transcriptional regulator [Candidatus Thermoplasmatota archaeon]
MNFYGLKNIISRSTISNFDIMIKNLYNGFIRIHILYHAVEEKICGIEIIKELKRHGYTVSPGTIYPILHKMSQDNFLVAHNETVSGKRRIYYRATPHGKKVLEQAREKIKELYDEVILDG